MFGIYYAFACTFVRISMVCMCVCVLYIYLSHLTSPHLTSSHLISSHLSFRVCITSLCQTVCPPRLGRAVRRVNVCPSEQRAPALPITSHDSESAHRTHFSSLSWCQIFASVPAKKSLAPAPPPKSPCLTSWLLDQAGGDYYMAWDDWFFRMIF
jgi:hypothetical protein